VENVIFAPVVVAYPEPRAVSLLLKVVQFAAERQPKTVPEAVSQVTFPPA
jgi:hypothetical protein